MGAVHQCPDTLRDALTGMFRRGNQSTNSQSTNPDDLWALKDVSCEVKRGEVVGTPALASGASVPSTELCVAPRRGRTSIGRNVVGTLAPARTLAAEARAQAGAGESTLVSTELNTRLKILSRITEPTSGTAETCGGRVGSLLAVGDAVFQKKRWSWYNVDVRASGEVLDGCAAQLVQAVGDQQHGKT